jgi:hypothetical protein
VFLPPSKKSPSTPARDPRSALPQVTCSLTAAMVPKPDAVERTRDLVTFPSFP